MKKLINISLIIGFLFTLFISCNEDSSQQIPIAASKDMLNVVLNELDSFFYVGGNGTINVQVTDKSIADISLKNNVILVKGLKKGETNITITDGSGKQLSVPIVIYTPAWLDYLPAQAAAAGFRKLSFFDEFDENLIDTKVTGDTKFKWFIDRPFGWSNLTEDAYSVENSILHMKSSGCVGWGLSTYSNKHKKGKAFRYGYFECRMRFDSTLGPDADWFPCFWSFSTAHSNGTNNSRWGELDFYEAYTGGRHAYNEVFIGTVHDWLKNPDKHYQNSNNWSKVTVGSNFSEWHTYGCSWSKGVITWYYDNKPLNTLKYYSDKVPEPQSSIPGPEGTFSILDSEYMQVILGTAGDKKWPFEVDWVRVWQ